MNDISGYFRRLVERQLPGDARILASFRAGDVVIQATWRLRHDAHRPSRLSPLIRIVISVEAVEGYVRGDDEERLASDRRFVAWLGNQLAALEADRDSALGAAPAVVEWRVNGTILQS